ncbi:MAG: 30S ribosomal protein S7 [Candidatus Hadarchaeales archaeon]
MEFKYFGKWSAEGVEIKDPGMKKYLRLQPTLSLSSGGRHASKPLGKAEVPIVERLINKIMRSGPGAKKIGGRVIRGAGACGKKHKAYNIVKRAFEIIEERTGKNPLQVLVDAIHYAAPREETTRITYGGITYHVAVDASPARGIDVALMNIAAGAFAASFRNKKPIEECLAEEIILASQYDSRSYAVARKEEIERIAEKAR